MLAAAVLSARSAGSGRAAVLPQGATTGVIALDMSASIAGPVYQRVATTLKGIVAANQRIGLVMFSDVAYELLPPNSPAGALLQFLRFFQPLRTPAARPSSARARGTSSAAGRASPRPHRGAAVAPPRRRRARLDPAGQRSRRLLGRPGRCSPRRFGCARRTSRSASSRSSPIRRTSATSRPLRPERVRRPVRVHTRAGRRTQPVAAATPWALIALGVVLVLLLAGNERFNTRLDLGVAA